MQYNKRLYQEVISGPQYSNSISFSFQKRIQIHDLISQRSMSTIKRKLSFVERIRYQSSQSPADDSTYRRDCLKEAPSSKMASSKSDGRRSYTKAIETLHAFAYVPSDQTKSLPRITLLLKGSVSPCKKSITSTAFM